MRRARRGRKAKPPGKHLSISATDKEWGIVRRNADRRGLSIARYLVGLAERGGPEEIAGPALALDAGEQRELLEAVREIRSLMLEGVEAQFLAHPHPADDGQADAPALDPERPGLVGRAEARAAALLLEARIARALREEGPERHAQVDHGLLGGAFRHVVHPRELGPLAPVQGPAQRRLRRLRQACPGHPIRGVRLAGRMLPAPLRQRPVPGSAGRPRGPQEIVALAVRRIERDAMRDQHDPDSSTARATPSSSLRFLCDRLP